MPAALSWSIAHLSRHLQNLSVILLDVPSALAGIGPNSYVAAIGLPVDAMTGMIHAGFMCSPKWLIYYLGLITALGKHSLLLR